MDTFGDVLKAAMLKAGADRFSGSRGIRSLQDSTDPEKLQILGTGRDR